MAQNSHTTPDVPADLIASRQAGWKAFTRFTVVNCVAIAGILVLMLVFLRIL